VEIEKEYLKDGWSPCNKNKDYEYQVFVNGECIYVTHYSGLALLRVEACKIGGYFYELYRLYIGNNFDPVLHDRKTLLARGNLPPCPEKGKPCKYRKSKKEEFYNTIRPTAIRTEVMAPRDRCGWLLLLNRKGGDFWDYSICIG